MNRTEAVISSLWQGKAMIGGSGRVPAAAGICKLPKREQVATVRRESLIG